MRVLFWMSALLVAYVYAGYPVLLAAWARLRRPRRAPDAGTPAELPGISIVVAARNEARRLPARLDNLLEIAYPGPRQIIVVSDGSTDNTVDVLAPYAGRGVETISVPPGGKACALNAGVARATHPIVVFADARQVFAPDALLELVAPFADPAVGGVTGELLLETESDKAAGRRTGDDRRRWRDRRGTARVGDRRAGERRGRIASTVADGVGLYWKYEKALRRLESRVASTLGATGAIYALRRQLFRPLPPDTVLDDVLAPMRAVLAGYRIVFNERAIAFDRTAADADAEARRKVRTLAGNFQILRLEPRLLVPVANPVWLQYVSHKLGRLLVPYALLGVFAGSVALAGSGLVFALALAAQCLLYLLAGYGAWLEFTAAPRPAPAPIEDPGIVNA